ncbi:MAG TPA: thioredoxin domain-containing protein [Pyrinomonadaceae bacterium]|nr:thioredoxin domain-containing protein [Pyrinomonadaceae bacterium]
MKNYRPFLIIAIVLTVSLIGGILLLRSGGGNDSFTNGAPTPVPSTGPGGPSPAENIVTLEEFGDYQCPPCGQLHPTLKKLNSEFSPRLNFVFRNLPLVSIHKNAMLAAQAAEAARVQNRFWEMHDLLYESQKQWSEEANPKPIFLKLARDLGLDIARFESDLASEEVKMRIQADQEAAARQGIDGTPTILINGRRLRVEATTPEGIRTGLELMMGRKAAPTP